MEHLSGVNGHTECNGSVLNAALGVSSVKCVVEAHKTKAA